MDLTKAFDSVNRDGLWIILGKLGCPPGFVKLFKDIHQGMKGRFNFNGSVSEEFPVENKVKQGVLRVFVSCHMVAGQLECHMVAYDQ